MVEKFVGIYDARAIEMDLHMVVVQKKQRVNDRFIMDILVESGELSQQELIGINKFQQHLKVIMLSDITDLRGTRILQNIREDENRRSSRFLFSYQEPEPKWKTWWIKKACPILQKQILFEIY